MTRLERVCWWFVIVTLLLVAGMAFAEVQPLVAGGRVYDGFSVDGCGHVRYRADAVVRGRIQWWLGIVGGGAVMAEIFSENFDSGTKGGFQ